MKHIGTSVERGQVHNAFFKAPLEDIISHSYLLLPSRSINPGKDKKINVKGNREMFWDLNPEKIIWTPFLQAAFPFLTFTIITLPLNSPFRQSYHLTPVSLPQLSAILLCFFFFLILQSFIQALIIPRWVTVALPSLSVCNAVTCPVLLGPALTATGQVSILPTTLNPRQMSYQSI